MCWLPRQRGKREPEWRPPARIPDHDRVFAHRQPGDEWWSPLIGGWLEESTQPLPLTDVPPEAEAGRWRARGDR